MTDLMKVAPPKFGEGPVDGQVLSRTIAIIYRDVLSRMDVRYSHNDFKQGLVADNTGKVTLGTQAFPVNRGGSIPAIVQKITDVGVAQDQRFLPQVSAGNKLSVQSALVLTASSDATSSIITVSPHTLQYGFGQVPYNSGSISGLAANTDYYVYANDEQFTGGAVSYKATTNPQTVVAANANYYVGAITTPITSNTQTITGATSANPIVCTTGTTHGWSSGDTVTFSGMPGGFAVLNGTNQVITVTDTTHFSVAVNGTGFVAYTSGGTAQRVSTGTTGGGGGGGGFRGGNTSGVLR